MEITTFNQDLLSFILFVHFLYTIMYAICESHLTVLLCLVTTCIDSLMFVALNIRTLVKLCSEFHLCIRHTLVSLFYQNSIKLLCTLYQEML